MLDRKTLDPHPEIKLFCSKKKMIDRKTLDLHPEIKTSFRWLVMDTSSGTLLALVN
jgi:hypothetical protein